MISYRLVGFRRDFCISKRIFFANALLGALLTLIYSVDYSSLYHQVTIDLYASARSCYLFQSWPIYALLTFRVPSSAVLRCIIKYTAAHWAVKTENVDLLKILVASGLDPNCKSHNGGTLLHLGMARDLIFVLSYGISRKPRKLSNPVISKSSITS